MRRLALAVCVLLLAWITLAQQQQPTPTQPPEVRRPGPRGGTPGLQRPANTPPMPKSASTAPARPGAPVNRIDQLRYVAIPAGTFQMGCVPGDTQCRPDESPRHQVTITQSFWMTRTEVPVSAYRRFIAATAKKMPQPTTANPKWLNEDYPMSSLTWNDAGNYCSWAGGRLPTEAEWEYAARGGTEGNIYEWGDSPEGGRANAFSRAGVDFWELLAPVASFAPNRWGLYDMSGNVWEWTSDWYGPYSSSPLVDPTGEPAGKERVRRGGGFNTDFRQLRLSARGHSRSGSEDTGFRCVMTAPAAQWKM